MQPYQTISIITGIIVIIISVIVAFKTTLLKETGVSDSPYSLSKFQFWLWTTVICPAFIIHWGFHFPDNPFINVTSLILLGIAGGVTLTSGLITQVSEAKKTKNPTITLQSKSDGVTKGFWIDLLTGDNEKTPVERLQNLLFTFIYIVIYVSFFFSFTTIKEGEHQGAITNMNYIIFEPLAYVLMGVSAGSYLIGKGMNR